MGVMGIAALAKAGRGPIDPPAGPVTPTGRTLDEIYNKIPGSNGTGDGRIPIAGGSYGAGGLTISTPGSYVLTGNVSATGPTAITIITSNVTLDLNGFTVTAAGTGAAGVISITGVPSNITVRNGFVVGGNTGVGIGNSVGTIIEDLVISGTRQYGVASTSPSARGIVVRRCKITDVGALTTSGDGNLNIGGIFLQGNAYSVVTDNIINRLLYNGSGTPTYFGIYTYGPGTGGVVIAGNSINIYPVLSGGTILAGVYAPSPVTGIIRGNSVIGITPGYNFAGVDGGGNV